MKTIFISSFHVFISRNILSAPFFALLKQLPNLKIVVLVPEAKKEFFEKEYGEGNVIIEGIKRKACRRDAYLNDLALAAMRTTSTKIRRKEGIGWIFRYTHLLFFWAPLIRQWYGLIYKALIPKDTFQEVLNKYKPDLVFATDVFSALDPRLMCEAQDRGIKTIGMVRSWDNLTTKGVMQVVPDILVVNNNILKEESVRLHGISLDRIRVVGIPHYDRYTDKTPRSSREEFYKCIGANPQKRLVLLSPLGDRFFKKNTFDRDIIEMIGKMLPDTHNLLVRLPPADNVNLEGFQKQSNIIFDRPGTHFEGDFNFKKSELSVADDDHLVDSLYYADAVIGISTTLTIDAAVFDKPLIMVAFNSYSRQVIFGSAGQLLEYNHVQPLIKSGGVKVANTPEELKSFLWQYLKNPDMDSGGRERIVNEQCYKVDGKSSMRLFSVIKEYLAS